MRQLDDLDNRIMREIGSPRIVQWNIRESYASIARRVGVDEETVRKRIKRMEAEGSIMEWRVMINPSLLGRSYAAVGVAVRDVGQKLGVLSQLRGIEGVAAYMNFEGGEFMVFLYSEPGEALTSKARRIGKLCGSETSLVEMLGIPPCELKLSAVDWKIIWAIRNDPRKNLSRIAEETNVSTRTVNRRLNALTDHGALFLIGVPNLRKSPGISANFLISCKEGHSSYSVADKIAAKLENIVFGGPFSSRFVSYNAVFSNLIEVGDAQELIMSVEGVAGVKTGIMKEMVFVPDWLDGEITKRRKS